MNKTSFLFLGAAISASALLLVGTGCGGDSGGNTGGTGGGAGGGSTTTTTTTSTTSTTSTSSASLDCTSYCAEVMANCTETNAQYASMDSCLGACSAFPVGTVADTSGDTLGCRLYHGGAPAVADPVMHCPHAGPTGGDKDPTDTAGSACGEGCESFCNIALKACASDPTAYTDKTACMTECKTFKADTADFSTADTGNNDFGCRMYHLTVAATDAASAATHCPHIRANSPVCTM